MNIELFRMFLNKHNKLEDFLDLSDYSLEYLEENVYEAAKKRIEYYLCEL